MLPSDSSDELLSVGVTIDIPEPYGSELRGRRLQFGDARAETIPAHITIIPPCTIPAGSWPGVREHIVEVADQTSPFTIELRGTGTFRPVSPVVFVAVANGIAHCQSLSAQLRQGVLDQDLAFPYHPHVTIAQELDDERLDIAYDALADFELSFMVHGFGVYLHGPDGEWRLQDRVHFGP
ncbi:2'-5' RNA ligase family protein [Sediminivirga luteola]|uniref:Phosphoesterase n=1 Tax=Sediminivirga luteola TaxID=1774748 RepID=A0A8J2XKN4_9MICO|nr:2'-5' RNA ligase family protein [Sediminivirga luteola]GGA11342.1 phosphoesterase [Sediminivirga luteola]